MIMIIRDVEISGNRTNAIVTQWFIVHGLGVLFGIVHGLSGIVHRLCGHYPWLIRRPSDHYPWNLGIAQ